MARRTMTLLGPDVLLLAMGGARANNAVLVLECAAPVDAARVERAVAALRPIAPFMASRLERPLPWGRLRWTARDGLAVPLERRTLGPDDRLDAVVEEILNRRVDPRREPPLAWHVIEQGDAGWLVLAWVHALMDPRGAELLVGMLDAVDSGGERAAWAAARPIVPPEDERPAKERGALAQSAMGPLRALGRERPPTLARSGETAGATAGRVRHRRRLVRSAGRQLPQ